MRPVYVLDMNGKPLMPTCRFGKVRRMLKSGEAKVVDTLPFTIQLDRPTKTHVVQSVTLGCDPGRTNIGLTAVRSDGTDLYRSHCETRNKEIVDLMDARRAARRASRRGERLARKRLATKHETATTFPNGRKLPGCNILPVSDIALEINKFAFMQLDEPDKNKWNIDFQHGPLYGTGGLKAAVRQLQNDTCLLCQENAIEHFHHLVPRSKRGDNTINNIVGLCRKCHEAVHKFADTAEKLSALKKGQTKRYGGTSVLNQIIPKLVEELGKVYHEHLHLTYGWQTKEFRTKHKLEKTHDTDAYCIAAGTMQTVKPNIRTDVYEIKQFRKHNRANIHHQTERTYKLNGQTVARNRRKRTDQKTDSLAEWFENTVKQYGQQKAEHLRAGLKVRKSTRYYNSKDRVMPGAVFQYEGNRYVVTGQLSGGQYYRAYGKGNQNFPAKKIRIISLNRGLVYVA